MNLNQIEQAARRLNNVIHLTPDISSRTFSEMSGAELYLKCENLQKTGSFKVRGAYNKIARMADGGPLPPLFASSAGNHAQGVAYAASTIGARATIVMPKTAPLAKVAATEGYGVEVVLEGDGYDEAYEYASRLCAERGGMFIHAFDDEDVVAGQGTIGLEILRSMPTVNTVLIPAGGGGLLAGMSACIKQINPRVRVVGVQAEGADAIVRTFASGERVSTKTASTIADGIAVKSPGAITSELILKYVNEMVTVSDDEIAEAILLLLERTKMVVEPAGAVTVAAAINRKLDFTGQRIVCLLSGGNIDMSIIHRVIERGLVSRGRQMKFRTVIPDVPGTLQHFSGVVASCGANIILIQYDRLNADLHLNETLQHFAVEVSGPEHGQRLLEALRESGYDVQLG